MALPRSKDITNELVAQGERYESAKACQPNIERKRANKVQVRLVGHRLPCNHVDAGGVEQGVVHHKVAVVPQEDVSEPQLSCTVRHLKKIMRSRLRSRLDRVNLKE